MALPTDSSETFLREVDENLRRDQLRDVARKYAKWVVVAVVLFLGVVGGWLYWKEHKARQSAEDSEQLVQIYRDIGSGKTATAPARLDALAEKADPVTRATALFASAAIAVEKNDRSAAAAKYREISDDEDLPDPYRNLATIRQTAIEFDTIKPEEVVARLQPLAKAGEPWFGSAGELIGMAYLKQNKKAEAGRMFAAIAADKQVPETIRSRAVQIAGTLGVDASASLPQTNL